ncbi:MAG TPA: tetratricopeptide repeat protein [Steroidobacteraceae bacterium]
MKAWLKENGPWIIAGVVVAALAVTGYRWYQRYVDQAGAQASAKYLQMVEALGRGDHTNAFVVLGDLERNYPSSAYVDQARLMAARADVETGELDKAATELQSVVAHSKDPDLALVARLRLARVQIAQHKADAALATLDAVQPGAFAPAFHEVRGDAFYAKGDKANALKEYLSAKAAGAGGVPDGGPLDLKITELSAGSQQPRQAITPAPAAAPAK